MKHVRQPLLRLCASWGFLLGKACEQAEFASPVHVDLPTFRHPQLTLFSMPASASVSGYSRVMRLSSRKGWIDG